MSNNIKRMIKEEENTGQQETRDPTQERTKRASGMRGKGDPKMTAVHQLEHNQPTLDQCGSGTLVLMVINTRCFLLLDHLSKARTECPELVQTLIHTYLTMCY